MKNSSSLHNRHRDEKGKQGEQKMLSFLRIEGDTLSQCFQRSDAFSFISSLKKLYLV